MRVILPTRDVQNAEISVGKLKGPDVVDGAGDLQDQVVVQNVEAEILSLVHDSRVDVGHDEKEREKKEMLEF